ncbi:MAG: molybdopterin molybdotransferase MoeA [Gammaproteobacteria bacterium]|nr:molybdopterin molybdotransferase MoeA [Gammaproteobacteria bacterium]
MLQNSQPLDLEEALIRLYERLPQVETYVNVKLSDALGAIVAKDIIAPGNLPPFRASAMDGYAIIKKDFEDAPESQFSVIGASLAGHPFTGEVNSGECVRIFTGAKVPQGADQVILQEQCLTRHDSTGSQSNQSAVTFKPHQPAETYLRPIGHDVKQGQPLAKKGDQLDGFLLGALAASGIAEVCVFKKPTVGVFSTGDELVDPGTPLAALRDGQIYDSNRFTVINLLRHSPCTLIDLGRLPDDAKAVENAFMAASKRCQILITSGGVSVGDADFITATLKSLGKLDFWRLNLKPGKPLAFGQIHNCYVFGLPGNPVSTIVTLLLLAKPAIWHCAGARAVPRLRLPARLRSPLEHTPGRAEFQRGTLDEQEGLLHVTVTGDQSSNRLSTFKGANCLIEIPKTAGNLPAGATVWVSPFTGLLS